MKGVSRGQGEVGVIECNVSWSLVLTPTPWCGLLVGEELVSSWGAANLIKQEVGYLGGAIVRR